MESPFHKIGHSARDFALEEFVPVKLFLMVFLPLVHLYEDYAYWGMLNDAALRHATNWSFITDFGTAFFMILMGLRIYMASDIRPRGLIRQGVFVIILFFFLKALGSTIPCLLGYAITNDASLLWRALVFFFDSDILMFSGLSLFFFALMRFLHCRPTVILSVSLLLLALGIIFSSPLDDSVFSAVLGNFLDTGDGAYYPFLLWVPFPVVGYIFGHLRSFYTEKLERSTFYDRVLGEGFTALAVCIATLVPTGLPDNGLMKFLLYTSLAFISFGLSYYLSGIIKSPYLRRVTRSITDSIVFYYLLQWVLVSFSETFLVLTCAEQYCLGVWQLEVLALTFTVGSFCLSVPLKRLYEEGPRALNRRS